MSNLSDNKTLSYWKNFLEKLIGDFKDKGYNFSHIAEMHIITKANKMDLLHDFYIKYDMCALEWKISALINEDKSLIKNLNQNWRHPLNRNFESYRV